MVPFTVSLKENSGISQKYDLDRSNGSCLMRYEIIQNIPHETTTVIFRSTPKFWQAVIGESKIRFLFN